MVAIAKSLTTEPLLQAALGLVACTVFLFLQGYNRPFMRDRLDVLDCAALMAMSMYIFAGILFTIAAVRRRGTR